jgi:hypothetical protein
MYFTTRTLFWEVCQIVFFWTELSRWRQCVFFPNKVTLLPCWSYCYKKYTVFVTNCLIVTKDLFSKWQWNFFLLCRFVLSSITDKTITQQVSHKKQELHILPEQLASPLVFGAVRVNLFSILFCVFSFLFLLCVYFVQCCLCLSGVNTWLPFRFSLTFIATKFLNLM